MEGAARARPPAGVAPVRADAGGPAPDAGRVRARRPHPAGRRARARRRHGVVVVRDPRLPPPRARRGGPRPARTDGARHVRGPHPRARRPPGAAPVGHDRARARVLRRLGLGVGRGRDQDGAAVLGRRAPPAADRARGLPRRHVRGHGGLRPGERDARPVHGRAGRPRLRRPPAGRLRRRRWTRRGPHT